MQEQYLKINVRFSWHLIWIFALLEGVTVPLVPLFSENGASIHSTAHTATVAAQSASFAKNMMMIFGFVSAAGSFIVASVIYSLLIRGLPNLRIQLITTEQRLLSDKIRLLTLLS